MLLPHRNIVHVTFVLLAMLTCKTEAKKSKKYLCPIGFNLTFTRTKGDAICYRLKEPEVYANKFEGCAGNLYTYKLYSDLNLKHPRVKLWAEYKSAYPGGPFVDWSYSESTGDLLATSYDVAYDELTGLEEECLVMDNSINPNFTSVSCEEQHYRFCLVKPYPDEEGMTREGCEGLDDYWRFWSPRATCLNRVTGLWGGAVRASWKQAQELCAKRGALLLHRGWRYANNPFLHSAGVTRPIPIGAFYAEESVFVWSHEEDDNIMIPKSEFSFTDASTTEEDTLVALVNNSWHLVNSTYLFFDVMCERSIHLRKVNMEVIVYWDRKIKLRMNESVDENETYCFTDSAAYYPTSVEIQRDDELFYDLKPARNGYYWCMHYDSRNYRVAESNKTLYVREDRSLYNLYAIKIRTFEKYDLNDLEKLYKAWERNLREYILARTRHEEVYGPSDLDPKDFKEMFSLDKFKKMHPDLRWRVNVIESMRLKRVFRDRRTVLLHVDINPEMMQVPPGVWKDLDVLYMKPAYYCAPIDSIPLAKLGESVTRDCKNYTCVGDFNEGVQWVATMIEGCSSRPPEWSEATLTFKDPLPSTHGERTAHNTIQLPYINTSESSDSSEEYVTKNNTAVTTELPTKYTTEETTKFTTTTPTTTTIECSDIPETVSTVNTPTEEVTVVPQPSPPRPPPSVPTTTTQMPTTTLGPPDQQLQQVMEDLENLLNNDSIPVVVENVSNAVDRVDVLLEEENDLDIPGELLHLLDMIGARVDLNGSQMAAAVGNNIALLMADASPDKPIKGLRIATRENDTFNNNAFEIISKEVNSTDLTVEQSEAVVHLPQSVSESNRRISFVVFRTDRAFQSNRTHYVVNSRVLSINVEDNTRFVNGEVIDIHLRPITGDPERNTSRTCAYWHFLDDGTGYWSEEGCTFIRASAEGLMDTCRCDHLTHFAEILVPRSVFSEKDEDILEILTIVGCSLSIFGVLLIGLTAVVFRSWRRDFSNKIWLQLCIAILLLSICFLIVVFWKFETYNIPCMLTGIALHYSVLASFCWMLVAAVLSYRRLVLVFTRDASHKLLRASAFSWGVPCAVVGILLSVSPHSYAGQFEEKMPNGAFCYPSGLGFWLSVYAPIALMLLANWTLFILIVRSVFASRRIQRHGDTNEAFRCASVSCLLVFLFGLPWIFGLFSYNIVAAYFFTLTANFQGFVLFLFFVVCNKKTRDLWLNKLKIKQTRKIPVTSSTYTNKSTASGRRISTMGPATMASNSSKPRSLASPDDSRFS